MPLASWHQIADGAQLGEVLATAAARIPTERVRIAPIGDGSSWLWTAMTAAFPSGREVLDYYHCTQHLWTVANLQYADQPEAAPQWVEATITLLAEDTVEEALAELTQMLPRTHATAREIDKLIAYLTDHSHRFGYDTCKRAGLPIGSGAIRIGQQSDRAYAHEAPRRLMARSQRQHHASPALRPLQRHVLRRVQQLRGLHSSRCMRTNRECAPL